MKKTIAMVMVGTALMLSMTVFAANNSFVDTNKDGICDNYVSSTCNKKNANANCTGKNKHSFVDANKDGVCDNKDNQSCNSTGSQYRGGKGMGKNRR